MGRRLYIDWLRGLAVLAMMLWHAVDAWTIDASRQGAVFAALVFSAGWVAPTFLFLAGISIPLAGASRMSRGRSRDEASLALQRRGWQVFALAHLFRLQSFLLNPGALWSSIFKPDILNVLGLGMVAGAFLWGRAPATAAGQARWLLAPAVVVAGVLTPLSRIWAWPALLHPRLEAYIRPVGSYGVFSIFPSVAYVLAGVFVGALLAGRPAADRGVHRGLGLAGLTIAGLGLGVGWVPAPLVSTWASPLAVFLWRTGTICAGLWGVWWWFGSRAGDHRDPLILFGQTSLFVYWVHVELAYGVFSYPLHRSLDLPWALAAWIVLVAGMFVGARAWRRWRAGRSLVPARAVAASARRGSRQP